MQPTAKELLARINGNFSAPDYTGFPDLTPDEIAERSFDLTRLYQISQVRESSLPQFDGMGYMRYNETNEMADISYLPPKKNKGDSRVTTGITHEKDSSLVSWFLGFHFEGTVRVFRGDKELSEVGVALTKMVRKSREQEFYDDKRPYFYRNFVAQGTSFALEQYLEKWVPDKKIIGTPDPTALDKTKWIDNGLKKVSCGCESSLTDGKKVYMEDIRQPDIQKQPGVYIVDYIPRETMEAIWGKTERWKYVPRMVNPTATALATLANGSIYSDWIFGEIDFSKMEVIRVFRPIEQRYQIYFNGVPMLKAKFPLKAVSPSGLIPLSKGDIDLMNMFAYSKSEPAKTKIDQALFDEVLQNMIIKFRQSVFVPRANNSERILTPDMFLGGRTISNINPDEIKPLIEQPGLTAADFSFYKLFDDQISKKTISNILQGGEPEGGNSTYSQYMQQQQKSIQTMGGRMDGLIGWERQMLRLRTMNLLFYAYDKDPEGNYKDIPIEDSLSNGLKGMNVIKFMDGPQINSMTPDDVYSQEQQYKEQTGTDAEFTILSPTEMRGLIEDPKVFFKYEIVPVDKNNDKLTQAMFVAMVTQAANLFGMESLQVDSLKKQYASVMGKPFDDIFLSPEQVAQNQAKAQQAAMIAAQAGGDGSVPSPFGGQQKTKAQVDPMFQ